MNIYMNIHNILYLIISLLLFYIFIFNLLKYNKVIEGASLSEDEIEMIYTQHSDISELTQQKNNIETKITNVNTALDKMNTTLDSSTKEIQSKLRKAENKLAETGVKKKKG
jgi:peptidoglycan hydrolase CwlO-like protein